MILVAENLTVTDSEIARAVERREPEPLRRLAAVARRAGARYLDVNLGSGARGDADAFGFVCQTLRGCWAGGVLVDSTRAAVMESAAELWARDPGFPGSLVLNGYSGDPGRERILEIAASFGLELVVLLMARGIPRLVEERLALAAELVGRCQERGIDLDRIWIDPVVAPLGWTDGQDLDSGLIEILRRLPELFGRPVKTLLGLSNLNTSAVGRRRMPWMEEVFLAMAAGAGLTHAMVNVKNERIVRVARALEVLTGQRAYAPDELH